jgi:hypothetical protein
MAADVERQYLDRDVRLGSGVHQVLELGVQHVASADRPPECGFGRWCAVAR